MRTRFDEQLAKLNRALTQMGAMCEEAIALAAQTIISGDRNTAVKVHDIEAEIDKQERDIQSLCLRLLLQQQPVAKDLKQISAALKMITDMERIGDQAYDISEMAPFLSQKAGKECDLIKKMAEATIKMVTDSIDAYVKKDAQLAAKTIEQDDIVDLCFKMIKETLIGVILEHPDDGEYALDLLMTAKYFERIGDHAQNIAEWVLFSVSGVIKGEKNT